MSLFQCRNSRKKLQNPQAFNRFKGTGLNKVAVIWKDSDELISWFDSVMSSISNFSFFLANYIIQVSNTKHLFADGCLTI